MEKVHRPKPLCLRLAASHFPTLCPLLWPISPTQPLAPVGLPHDGTVPRTSGPVRSHLDPTAMSFKNNSAVKSTRKTSSDHAVSCRTRTSERACTPEGGSVCARTNKRVRARHQLLTRMHARTHTQGCVNERTWPIVSLHSWPMVPSCARGISTGWKLLHVQGHVHFLTTSVVLYAMSSDPPADALYPAYPANMHAILPQGSCGVSASALARSLYAASASPTAVPTIRGCRGACLRTEGRSSQASRSSRRSRQL